MTTGKWLIAVRDATLMLLCDIRIMLSQMI